MRCSEIHDNLSTSRKVAQGIKQFTYKVRAYWFYVIIVQRKIFDSAQISSANAMAESRTCTVQRISGQDCVCGRFYCESWCVRLGFDFGITCSEESYMCRQVSFVSSFSRAPLRPMADSVTDGSRRFVQVYLLTVYLACR